MTQHGNTLQHTSINNSKLYALHQKHAIKSLHTRLGGSWTTAL